MSEHRELLELIPSYALGALDAEDRRRLEAHLETGCAECEAELAAATRDLESLAETVPPVAPSQLSRARLLARVAGDSATASRRAASRWLPRVAAAAVLLLLGWSLWSQVELRRELARQIAARGDAELRFASAREELASARAELERIRLANRIVGSPQRLAVRLAGLEEAPRASARTYLDPVARRAVFYATDLSPAGAGRTYQLWFIAGGTPVSAGTFDVDEEGSAMLLVNETAASDEIQLWAVTLEPAGGVAQPTGPMVLRG